MSKVNTNMHERNSLVDLRELEQGTPADQNAARQSKSSPFPKVEDVLMDLEKSFDLRGLVA